MVKRGYKLQRDESVLKMQMEGYRWKIKPESGNFGKG